MEKKKFKETTIQRKYTITNCIYIKLSELLKILNNNLNKLKTKRKKWSKEKKIQIYETKKANKNFLMLTLNFFFLDIQFRKRSKEKEREHCRVAKNSSRESSVRTVSGENGSFTVMMMCML